MVSRRTFLAVATTAFAPAAGCASFDGDGRGDGPRGTADPAGTPTATPDDSPGVEVAVHDIVVRKAVTYDPVMGSGGVLTAEGEQYVVGAVAAERELSIAEFAFEADGESWRPRDYGHVSVAGRGSRFIEHADVVDRAYLAFAVPSPLSAADSKIVFSGAPPGEWALHEEARERLAAPEARFELVSLSVPEEVTAGEPLEVTLEVRNVSETDGRFLAALYWPTSIADDDESHVVEQEVPAGGEATVSRSIDTEYTDVRNGPVTLRVTGHVTAEREVHVTESSDSE